MPRFDTSPTSAAPGSFGICTKGLCALSKRDSLVGLDSITISRAPFKGSSLITRADRSTITDGSFWTHHGKQWFVAGTLTDVLVKDFATPRIYIRVNFTPSA